MSEISGTAEPTAYEAWSILEVMGHRRLGGFVREVQVAGAGFFRIDVPSDTEGETHSTQFYPPSSIYCLTPVSEAAARVVARSSRPEPVTRWELPQPKPTVESPRFDCPSCGSTITRPCFNCDEPHPCSCMEPDSDDDKTDGDDF